MKFGWRQWFGPCLPRGPRQLALLLVGINSAGKTTLLNSLQGDLFSDTVPTYGFNSAEITTMACLFKVGTVHRVLHTSL
jgi:GTPase SAR1 family protein